MVQPVPKGFTCWDKIKIDKGDLTVQQVMDLLPEIHHGVKFDTLFIEDSGHSHLVWSSFPATPAQKKACQENPAKTVSEVFKQLVGPKPHKKFLILSGSFIGESGDPVAIPTIQYILPK